MVMRGEQLKAELIDRVAVEVRERLGAERSAQVERFVRQLYAFVPPDDLLGHSPDNLYGAALALWRFAQARPAGGAKIRVYNPRTDDHGWKSSHTVVEIVNDDMPFLVDSVTAELNRLETEIQLIIHPVVRATRDEAGNLVSLAEPGAGAEGAAESLMHVQISEQPAERHEEIRQGLAAVLADVRIAVADWQAMREQGVRIAAELRDNPPPLLQEEIEEGITFLDWMEDNHFTYLGYREYRFEGQGEDAIATILSGTALGILRDEEFMVFSGLRNLGALPAEVRSFVRQAKLLSITKSNRHSTVHRRVPFDAIAFKTFDSTGKVIGERLFIGLFTSTAYAMSPRLVPILARKVERTVARAGFAPDSHDGKRLLHTLETYPREELFQVGEDELFVTAMGILNLQERQRIAVFVRRDAFERFVSCLVYVPRDRYNTELRLAIQEILEKAFEGSIASFNTAIGDEPLARIHFIVTTTQGAIPAVDIENLERQIADVARSWEDHLKSALVEQRSEEEGVRLARRYAGAFSAAYEERFSAASAVFDIGKIEHAIAGKSLAMNLYRPLEAGEAEVNFKIYFHGQSVSLSDVLPMLENLGLKVIKEIPYDVEIPGLEPPVSIRDFELQSRNGQPIDLDAVREPFHEVFRQVWQGEMEDDGFNTLVLFSELLPREVIILRAICKYLRQTNIPFSQSYMEETLAKNPELSRLLVDLFLARSDPARREGAAERQAEITRRLTDRLDQVTNLDEDRIIRRFWNLITATLRTNFFQKGSDGRPKSYVSFKLDSKAVDELPQPRPLREIFVYSPRVEAIHLRGGLVARGGIRWSDRREDFRTEVLGLMKAQMVKNTVIVPVGSKGGFVVKRPPAARAELMEEVVSCYRTLMCGLLDLTDNLVANAVVPPADVVRYDKDDPYLVVAADKGTATFSDIANGIAHEYGFWLDDAFASGGSAGYDHKKMAITSRGVWESVKRHFREIGKDVQAEDFTVVGVGDMSGDVFGNGMLMSPHIRLLGAFNHMHIFLDPDPVPAVSFAERQRLFNLPRSTWADYDPLLLSEGGGIFERSAKSIPLSPQVRARFGIEADHLPPNDLMRILLKAEVELLWFGGIGTYVKETGENHADVGDRANDALRIHGSELRAAVIGEGANLGMTQRGRIEYALKGGRLNTDFIDNSAGVDCSDHEVNIKILLGEIERAGDMTRKQRDELLRAMTDEVAHLVLRDNYLQTQAITVTHRLGAHILDRLARAMRSLERSSSLNRGIEYLPDDETLADRVRDKVGFTRPELAVLLSYTKLALYDELLASSLPDDPYMQEDLKLYFPTALRERFAEPIARHRLRREIIATAVTNSIVNRNGLTFLYETKEKTGMPAADIARGYVVSREVFGLRDLWARIEGLDNQVPAAMQATMLAECGRLIERSTVWFLREGNHPLDVRREIETYAGGVRELTEELSGILSGEDRKFAEDRMKIGTDQGVPADLSWRISCLTLLSPSALDVVRIAQATGVPAVEVGKTYFAVGVRFGLNWLRRVAAQLPTDNAWDKQAVTAIIDDLLHHQSTLTRRVLEGAREGASTEDLVEAWATVRGPQVQRTDQLLSELHTLGTTPNLAMLAVANRQLKSMEG